MSILCRICSYICILRYLKWTVPTRLDCSCVNGREVCGECGGGREGRKGMGDEGFGLFFFVSRAGSLTLCLHAREFVGVRVRVCVRGWSVAFLFLPSGSANRFSISTKEECDLDLAQWTPPTRK